MSNIISLMGKLACAIHPEDQNEILNDALNNGEISSELKEAIENADSARIESILDARTKIVCMLFPAKDDEDENEEQTQEDEQEDEEEKSLKVSFY